MGSWQRESRCLGVDGYDACISSIWWWVGFREEEKRDEFTRRQEKKVSRFAGKYLLRQRWYIK